MTISEEFKEKCLRRGIDNGITEKEAKELINIIGEEDTEKLIKDIFDNPDNKKEEKRYTLEEQDHLNWLKKYAEENGLKSFYNLFWRIASQVSWKFYSSKTVQFELNCPAIMNLSTRKDLNHRERTAMMMLYLKLGKSGEERLLEILKQQNNFKEKITMQQINAYKIKNKMLGISCEKLKEWHICYSEYNDCSKWSDND